MQGVRLPTAVVYPAADDAAVTEHAFGPYRLSAARDAPPAGTDLPVVAISHGNGGTPWAHRHLACRLALQGFVVVLPEHLGNSRSDNRLADTAQNLANRPRHVRLAVDAVLQDRGLAGTVSPDRVGIVGHSIGGYTALACAGGRPVAPPPGHPGPEPREIPVERDDRVAAVVLLAPACPWFIAGSLRDVEIPIMLRVGGADEVLPPEHSRIVERGVGPGARVDRVVVPGAGHFSFQDPFPTELAGPHFPPSLDPDGFDRTSFGQALATEMGGFLADHLRG